MLKENDRVVLSLSGGPDSTALLFLFLELQREVSIEILCAHINHCLRGKESDEDEAFIRNMCREQSVELQVYRGDTSRLFREEATGSCSDSIQSFARKMRYRYLYEVLDRSKAQHIALGHNRGDQAETIMFRILRGCSLEGLSGMQPVRGKLIRPLLDTQKEEIIKYLSERTYRHDSSNLKEKYLRNRIRLRLLPALEEYNKNISSALVSLGELCRKENSFITSIADAAFSGSIIVNNFRLISINLKSNELSTDKNSVLLGRIIKRSLYALSSKASNIQKKHIDSIVSLATEQKGCKRLNMPGNVFVEKDRNILTFSKGNSEGYRPQNTGSYNIAFNKRLRLEEAGLEVVTTVVTGKEIKARQHEDSWEVLDFESITPPLRVRFRKNGDRFHPLGMSKEMKLKDFFIKQKIPQKLRDSVAIIEDSKSILYVNGIRISQKCAVKPDTKKALAVQVRILDSKNKA